MSTHKQDADFLDSIIPRNLLEDAVEWIKANLSPDEVFSKDSLASWAEDNLREVPYKYLSEWAESNGYVKE